MHVPDTACSGEVSLDQTLAHEDILEHILCVTVLVNISRTAAFIGIMFQQRMQKS